MHPLLDCTDCHGSEEAARTGGGGPEGPHGSVHEHILKRAYRLGEVEAYRRTDYGLCWACHDPNVIESDASFGQHAEHLEFVSCSVCHDPHGVDSGGSDALPDRNRQLINFDRSVVFPLTGQAVPWWVDEDTSPGAFVGRCYLVCHSTTHDGWSQGP